MSQKKKTFLVDEDVVRRAKEVNNQGIEHEKRGQYYLAEQFYRAAYYYDPRHLGAAAGVISSLLEQGHIDDAIKFARSEFKRNQDNPLFLERYIDVLMEDEQYEEALLVLAVLDGMEGLGSGYDFEYNYGRCLFNTKNYVAAAERFRRANEEEEQIINYEYIVDCCVEGEIFGENEVYMLQKLSGGEDGRIFSLLLRRYWLGKYYYEWARSVRDSDEEKPILLFAQGYIKEGMSLKRFDDVENEQYLGKARKLLAKIEKRIEHLSQGFEITTWDPSKYKPPTGNFDPPDI